MMIAIWAVGLLLLAVWSGLMWATHALWNLVTAAPWAETVDKARALPLPEVLAPWFGPAWREWVESMAPFLQWAAGLLQGSGEFLLGLVPVALWIVWGAGAASLVALMVAAAGGLLFFRRRQLRMA